MTAIAFSPFRRSWLPTPAARPPLSCGSRAGVRGPLRGRRARRFIVFPEPLRRQGRFPNRELQSLGAGRPESGAGIYLRRAAHAAEPPSRAGGLQRDRFTSEPAVRSGAYFSETPFDSLHPPTFSFKTHKYPTAIFAKAWARRNMGLVSTMPAGNRSVRRFMALIYSLGFLLPAKSAL